MLSRREFLATVGAGSALTDALAVGAAASRKLKYRWVFIMSNLQTDSEVPRVEAILRDAAAAGYNGVALSDWKSMVMNTANSHYLPNLKQVINTAKKLHLQVIPLVCPIGSSESILEHNPNLAEGVPAKNVVYEVHNGVASLLPTASAQLLNGNLTRATANRFAEWSYQDSPGQCTFQDTQMDREEKPSLRVDIDSSPALKGTNARLFQKVSVPTYHQYRLTVWIKTEGFLGGDQVGAAILDSEGSSLSWPQWDISATQDWRKYQLIVNSLSSSDITVILGVWGIKGGKIWFNSPTLEEVGMLNLLRREGCPLTVLDDAGQQLGEGVEFIPVVDSQMGNQPYSGCYDISHDGPLITLKPGSKLKEGTKLHVSFWHAIPVYSNSIPACITSQQVYTIMQNQIEDVVRNMQPSGLFLSHDELRIINWCERCQAENKTPGALLAANVKRCQSMCSKVDPNALQCIWSDMFDPFHNAVNHYYLSNGTLQDSWLGLNKQTLIVNWNYGQRMKSMPWFARNGFRQILAGYYDGSQDSIASWLNDASGTTGIEGVMYTTWQNDYSALTEFAKSAWG